MKGTVKQCCVLGCCCSSWCGMRRISELPEVVWLDQGSLWNRGESILWWKYNLFSVFTVTAGGVGKLCWSLLCLLFTPWNVTVSGPCSCRAFLAESCHLSSRILHYQCPKLLVSTLLYLATLRNSLMVELLQACSVSWFFRLSISWVWDASVFA